MMNPIEERVRSRARKGTLRHAILSTVGLAGLLALSTAFPNMPRALPRSLRDRLFKSPRGSRDVAVSRLVKDGSLERVEKGGVRFLRLTTKGEQVLDRMNRNSLLKPPRKWDKKWRVVIFDIKEPRRASRDALRRELRNMGFWKLQDSVWVHPFPCEDYIALLKADLHVGKDILYLVVEEMEDDTHLRRHFSV